MIPWWWTLIALIVGELFGALVAAMCNTDKDEHKYIK